MREASPAHLFNHCVRSFYFAALLADRRGDTYDAEVLYLGSIMHDIGLVHGLHEPKRFEVVGADYARDQLLQRGLDTACADVVWDAIALHSSVGIAEYKGAEVALAHLGITIDVVGVGIEQLSEPEVDEILRIAPRLSFNDDFLELVAEHIRANPHVSNFNWMDNVARHRLEHHESPDFVQVFADNPVGQREAH